MRKRLRAPAPALVISVAALFVALAGTSYAAFTLPRNSVGTKQLRNGAVTGKKIRKKAVTAAKINTTGLVVPNALNATQLGGQPASAFVGTCAEGGLAAVASWYAPEVPADPTYVSPNRYGGEGGFACNGGTAEVTKESTGFFRVEVVPALPSSHTYLLFANPDSRSTTPLYVQANSAIAGPVWDVHVYDKTGAPADPYYLDVMIVADS